MGKKKKERKEQWVTLLSISRTEVEDVFGRKLTNAEWKDAMAISDYLSWDSLDRDLKEAINLWKDELGGKDKGG